MDKKTGSTYMLFTRDLLQNKRSTQTINEGIGKKYPKQMDMKKKDGIAILTSDKIDFKTKAIKRQRRTLL